ncbi:GTP-binding protein Era [Desulfuromusa kysingii]|uniref:GTPase Era n=1 Tax=Desulfuromusa kysingii TaxID=37625 RepID=A0A1H4BH63_9BACT|nr:GTPase Era [Desulfuromusa kysingii]SEA47503.1 GTP-binding protein Era [Desulfuromusa kysingii]
MTNHNFLSGYVAIIGRPNVGKSTLLNRVLGQKIAITSNKPQTTRNRILGIHNFPDGQALFVDTPGIHKAKGKLNRFMVDQAIGACADVDLILFLVEADDSPGGGDEYILKLLDKSKVPVFLIINKIDLVKPPKLLSLIQQYTDRFDFSQVVPVSAKSGDGVPDMLQAIKPYLPQGPRYYPEDMLTDQPERFIVAEMVREKIMRRTSEEIPYGVGVMVDTFEEKPAKNLVVIQATIHVERDSHKKIIVGKGGHMIRTVGQEARKDIEKLLGTRIFLELFVRVDKDWSQNERMLRELGYSKK